MSFVTQLSRKHHPWKNQDGIEKWTRKCITRKKSKMEQKKKKKKKKSQKCLRQEFKEVLYCFNCALEHPSEFSTTERTYRVW